ncbi:hypothetical protein ABKU94_06450, partial [Enterobacter kobei]
GGKNSLNRLIRCVCGKKIGPDPRNFNQRVSLGRNDLLIRTFPDIPYDAISLDISVHNNTDTTVTVSGNHVVNYIAIAVNISNEYGILAVIASVVRDLHACA